MPIYEFQCETCNKSKERIQKAEENPPKCCGKPMLKKVSVSSFRLHGEGWYKPNKL
jgi:putative FmdB family regulatory protein